MERFFSRVFSKCSWMMVLRAWRAVSLGIGGGCCWVLSKSAIVVYITRGVLDFQFRLV